MMLDLRKCVRDVLLLTPLYNKITPRFPFWRIDIELAGSPVSRFSGRHQMKSSTTRHNSLVVGQHVCEGLHVFEETSSHDPKALSHLLERDSGVEVIDSSDGYRVANITVDTFQIRQGVCLTLTMHCVRMEE